MFKSTNELVLGVDITTVFEDSSENVRTYMVGDMVEDLHYINGDEIGVVTGRLKAIVYEAADEIEFNPENPEDTLNHDMRLKRLVIDTSEKYNASSVSVPLIEVVEFEGETNVKRMKFAPHLIVNMTFKYSNYITSEASIEVNDVFDHVRIFNKEDIRNDITGKFEVAAFAYNKVNEGLDFTGFAFHNVDTGEFIITEYKDILELNEVYTYTVEDLEILQTALSELKDGDNLVVSKSVDTSNGNKIAITQKDISIKFDEDIICDGGSTSGLRVTGTAVLSGKGKVVTTTPYDSSHGSGVIAVNNDGELTINDGGISAVIEDDPVNKGQFGVCVYENAKLTINDGEYTAGWYCVTGNGSTTSADAVTVINGGKFTSVADYAIYHPHPGTLIINDGDISGAAGAIAANNGKIIINGGKFSVLGGGDTGNWGDGTSGLSDVALNLNARYGDIECLITGGTFYATAAGTIMIQTGSAHNVVLKITGGKFTSKPNDEWIGENFMCTAEPDEDGFYQVVPRLLEEG